MIISKSVCLTLALVTTFLVIVNSASAKEPEKVESVKQNAGTTKKTSAPVSNDASKSGSAQTASSKGRTLFESHCASCHAGGGNLVVPKKPVIGSHVLVTAATFKSYLNEPVGTMPHYQHLIQDDSLLNELYSYVKSMKGAAAAPGGKGAAERKLDKPPVKKQK